MAAAKDEPNDTTDLWRSYRKQQQARRARRLPARSQEIMDLARAGFEVKRVTDYQFRVDGQVDFYPVHRRFHHLKTGKRGSY